MDTKNDPANCGACATACKSGEVCSAGTCGLACVGGTTKCGTKCVDIDTNPSYCGSCTKACAKGEACVNGGCLVVCQSKYTNCSGTCVDTQSDVKHCGLCGNACKSGETCVKGSCLTLYASCAHILAKIPGTKDGVQTVYPTATSPGVGVYCDMTNGGWTLALLKNSKHNGAYGTFGAKETNVAVLKTDPKTASTSSTAMAGWLDLNALAYTDLRLAAYSSGKQTFRSEDIKKSSLRIKFGQNGYLLYNDVNGYYWCGGAYSYTDNGAGQVNKPTGAPSDCDGHTSLGSGWDFSKHTTGNKGLTLCGNDHGSKWMHTSFGGSAINYGTAGAAYAIWVRTCLPGLKGCPLGSGTSCATILKANSAAKSGLYTIKPVASGQTYKVYCDMVANGGGWTRVVNIRSNSIAHGDNTGAYGDVSVDAQAAKLSDAAINALSTVGYFRYNCGTYKAYVRTDAKTWTSKKVNSHNWSTDRGLDGTFECKANRSGYVFSDHAACSAGHTDYVAKQGISEGGGCYHAKQGWGLNGNLWAK